MFRTHKVDRQTRIPNQGFLIKDGFLDCKRHKLVGGCEKWVEMIGGRFN